MTPGDNSNVLKSSWLIGVLISLVGTLGFLGYTSNERRLVSLEQWRVSHELLVAQEVMSLSIQLTKIESEILWIRREMEEAKQHKYGRDRQ